ncbi:uncharacterized protein [Chiloscyllium punctatum]|uniref:uncharacterized protein n=1 Tax=Chiloscyllium punctatum TaxID=137246 RepID=UPI003B63D591
MTVILDKADYIQKMQQLLADTNTYQKREFDPTPQLTNRINNTLRNLQKNGQITRFDLQRMKPESNNTPRFYGLPKVHKPDIPLRPIVSLPGIPSHKLAKEQQKLKHPNQQILTLYTVNTGILGHHQKYTHRQRRNYGLTRCKGTVHLYRQNPGRETIANLLDIQNRQQDGEPINKDGILKLLDLCLTTHFAFNNQIYEQINGTPMGSPISGLIAEFTGGSQALRMSPRQGTKRLQHKFPAR